MNSALAVYACDPAATRGRRFEQAPAPTRTDYHHISPDPLIARHLSTLNSNLIAANAC